MSIRTPVHPSVRPSELLRSLRSSPPLVQCITNTVVTGFTANVLLAAGASPAMCDIVGEAGFFSRIAQATLINLGTPTPEQREAAREVAAEIGDGAGAWVLDPVAVGALPIRTALAADLLEMRPTIIRGNASEILALAGLGAGGRGVDATDDAESALDAASALARRTGGAVAVSGPVDLITDGERVVRVSNGHELLTRVTGGGCALGALMAAFLGAAIARSDADAATTDHALDAAVAASVVYGIGAERAAHHAAGPGSFAVALLDELAQVTPEDVDAAERLA